MDTIRGNKDMSYFNSIIDAFKMILSGQFTGGNLMVMSGVVLFFVGVIMLGASLPKNLKEREKMYTDLRNNR